MYTCSSRLPKDKHYACHVVGKLVKNKLRSPTTSNEMSKLLDRDHVRSVPKVDSELVKIYHRMIKYKTLKDANRLQSAVRDLKARYSMRDAARQLCIDCTKLRRLSALNELHRRRLKIADKSNVVKFFSSNRVSSQLPFKKYAKNFYLRSTLAVAYSEYVKNQKVLGDRVLSKSSVYRCLKGKFRTRRKIPFKDCQCTYCVNAKLLVDALIVAGMKGIFRSNTENVINSCCPLEKNVGTSRQLFNDGNENKPVLTDYNRDCIFRECKMCGVIKHQQHIIDMNEEIEWDKQVVWHQWEMLDLDSGSGESVQKGRKKKKRFDKHFYVGTLAKLFTLFSKSIHQLSRHIFDFRWQALQYEECKKQLQDGDVLMMMDFAQNHSHHRQDEVQSGLWSRNMTTIHPIVIYYCCREKSCQDLVKAELMMFSDDLKHDGHAVAAFIQKAIEHLHERQIPVKRIITFSDNCGTQYKSCRVFDLLSKYEIPVQKNYFGACHGKGEADGSIGRLSMTIDAVVRSGTYELGNYAELTTYCKNHLTIGNDSKGMCCHYERHYYGVTNINRDGSNDAHTVDGTRLFHSVRNTGSQGIIEVRASSCFCEVCFLGERGKCKNERLVLPFEWASINKGEGLPNTREMKNTSWGGSSQKYIYKPPNPLMEKPKNTIRNKRVKKKISSRFVESDQGEPKEVFYDTEDSSLGEYDSDASSIESEFEDNIPLQALIDAEKARTSVSPVSSRTRLHKNMWIRSKKEPVQLYLDDYEIAKGKPSLSGRESDEQSMLSGVSMLMNLDKEPIIDLTADKNDCIATCSTPVKEPLVDITNIPDIALSPIMNLSIERVKKNNISRIGDSRTWVILHSKLVECATFAELRKVVGENLGKLENLPEYFVGNTGLVVDKEDRVAKGYLPDDANTDYIPVETEPDGSCFFRALSRIVYGVQNRHLEMRCRVVIDSVLNFDAYTDDDYLLEGSNRKPSGHIALWYCDWCGVPNTQNLPRDESSLQTHIKNVYTKEILRVCHENTWASVWQIHAAANLMKSKINMLYPVKKVKRGTDVRDDFNRSYLPVDLDYLRVYTLLWTSLVENQNTYNHFVPLVERYIYMYNLYY